TGRAIRALHRSCGPCRNILHHWFFTSPLGQLNHLHDGHHNVWHDPCILRFGEEPCAVLGASIGNTGLANNSSDTFTLDLTAPAGTFGASNNLRVVLDEMATKWQGNNPLSYGSGVGFRENISASAGQRNRGQSCEDGKR